MSAKKREEEFLQLMDSCSGILHKVTLLYTSNEEERADLLQEIIYQCWLSFPSFKGEAKPSTWVYRVSLNTALVYRRKNNKQQSEITLEPDRIADLPAEYTEENRQRDALLQAIRRLPKTERMIITLHLDGYRNSEIATMTGCSKGNISVKIHRIKKELKHQLTEE
ncbi:MAG: RNA polymerase sigma factor [Proteiniphilum sp.]|nr:RNA polymerase sigma factor [Proteiniphilum sp.]